MFPFANLSLHFSTKNGYFQDVTADCFRLLLALNPLLMAPPKTGQPYFLSDRPTDLDLPNPKQNHGPLPAKQALNALYFKIGLCYNDF
ncbi:hypothetical protein STRDD12_00937 [Streptococcus sp. DD12]|nr:hypothetical protein STRDD12_00937 [Streptococcus sp. DD12]